MGEQRIPVCRPHGRGEGLSRARVHRHKLVGDLARVLEEAIVLGHPLQKRHKSFSHVAVRSLIHKVMQRLFDFSREKEWKYLTMRKKINT